MKAEIENKSLEIAKGILSFPMSIPDESYDDALVDEMRGVIGHDVILTAGVDIQKNKAVYSIFATMPNVVSK